MLPKTLLFISIFLASVYSAEENDLTILSWNIKMLPAPYGWLHNRGERAENIIQSLKTTENYEIILFQEAFSDKIRKTMYMGLQSMYPHQIIPDDNKCIGKSNSGLWVVSKIPITLIDEIVFSTKQNWDALSAKGAKLYSVFQDGQEFHIINTHLQADYKTKYHEIRTQQYTEIYEKLILPNLDPEIPLFLCGDLNISQAEYLEKMLDKLKSENGSLSGELLFSITGKNAELLDYILVKSNDFKFKSIERKIIKMSPNPTSFSDHYPIHGVFKWE
ncbi:MAG: hypothetical protein H8E85_02860 [Candidatus Marinimicrobia bacterium]|nr:hypothetical protein [Candidatus Neomarinimicrobiota bacterium]